jgi:hypothetical protein
MKKRTIGIIIAIALGFTLIGCDGGSVDPTKLGGGGLQQPYSPVNGQYVPAQ